MSVVVVNRYRLQADSSVLGGTALVIIIGALSLTPAIFILVNSFNVAQHAESWRFGAQGWADAFGNRQTLSAMGYSFLLSIRSLIGIALAFVLSWLLVRIRIPCRRFIELSLWIGYFLPALPLALSWILLLDGDYGIVNRILKPIGWSFNIYSIYGIIWVHLTATIVPVMTILLTPALRQLDASLEEAGRVCGAGPVQTIRRVLLPVLAPALLTVFLAGVIRGLEAFEIEQVLGTRVGIYVYATRIYDLIQSEPPYFSQAMALSTLFLGVLFVLAMLYQHFVGERQIATISGRGVSFRPMEIGKSRFLISGILIGFVLIAVYLPFGILLTGSFMKLFGFFHINEPFTASHWVSVVKDNVFLSSLQSSLFLGITTAGIGLILYSMLAYALVRCSLAGKKVLNILIWLPWAVPGILLGLSFLSLLLSVPMLYPLYGTYGSLVLILLVKEMPIGVHMMKTALVQTAEELEHVARVCGAGWFITYRRIILPMVSPMLVSIFAIVFMAAVKDISTIILLGSGTTKPLSLLMMSYSMAGEMQAAAIIGVILSLLGVAVALISRRYGLRLGTEAH